jgi:hypothetical protein
MFRKLGLFPSSGEGMKTPTLLRPLESANFHHWTTGLCLAFSKVPNRVGVSLPSPDDEIRSNFRNGVFSSI